MTGDWAASSPALPSRCQIAVLRVLPPSAGTGMYKLEGSFFSDTRDKLEEWEGDCGRRWYQVVKSPGSSSHGMVCRAEVGPKTSEWAPLMWPICL